jgi:hypothetical protein
MRRTRAIRGERVRPPLLKQKKSSAVGGLAGADCAILSEIDLSYWIRTGTLVVAVCLP